jgi:type 1 fimbriae regulatory protein FimB/type 1 fimbriae regulatory protein FimE
MAKAHLRLVAPATIKGTVIPRRPPNAKLRTREYMTGAEVERLMAAAKGKARIKNCNRYSADSMHLTIA